MNWGAPGPDIATGIISSSDAEIVCLQETTPQWERYLRSTLAKSYPFMEFRESQGRMGGGLAFLSKVPMTEVKYLPSNTGWFDGWIAAFDTEAGWVQVLNVHLQPPVGKNGSWSLSGYLFTGDERLNELQYFFSAMNPQWPKIVAGDFNDTDNSAAVNWLKRQHFTNAIPEFDRSTPTWQWRVGAIHVRRRMDHIVYSKDLRCSDAKVIRGGVSDHFPVVATLERAE